MWISVGCGNYEDTIRQQQVLNFFFFFYRQPVKVVEEKEREKCRERNGEKERNVNVRESQKSNFFLGFRDRFRR